LNKPQTNAQSNWPATESYLARGIRYLGGNCLEERPMPALTREAPVPKGFGRAFVDGFDW